MKDESESFGAAIHPPPATAPSRARYAVMAFLCVLSFLTYFDRVCIVRVQGDMQHDLHLSDEQFGLVLGAFWLAYALFEIPSGFLGDRYGARGTLTRIEGLTLHLAALEAIDGTPILDIKPVLSSEGTTVPSRCDKPSR